MLFALGITLQIKLLAVIDSVCELRNPIAQDDDARLATEGEVKFDVSVPEDEILNFGMLFQILLGKYH